MNARDGSAVAHGPSQCGREHLHADYRDTDPTGSAVRRLQCHYALLAQELLFSLHLFICI